MTSTQNYTASLGDELRDGGRIVYPVKHLERPQFPSRGCSGCSRSVEYCRNSLFLVSDLLSRSVEQSQGNPQAKKFAGCGRLDHLIGEWASPALKLDETHISNSWHCSARIADAVAIFYGKPPSEVLLDSKFPGYGWPLLL
jgi:hypothetical protein